MALVENLQRQDLNPLEAAVAMQRLRDEFKLSQDQLGRLLGMSKSMVRTLGLLSLHKEVQLPLRSNQLDAEAMPKFYSLWKQKNKLTWPDK